VFAIFGINSDGLNLAVNLLLLVLFVVYVALVYWTFTDARRRISDPILVTCATVASLFPFVGTVVYMIVRPPEYLDDVYEREISIQASETLVQTLSELRESQQEVSSSLHALEQTITAARRRRRSAAATAAGEQTAQQ
jgi:hypothetical protein